MNKIKRAFDTVTAEDTLKDSSILFIGNKLKNRERMFKFRYIYKTAAIAAACFAVIFGIKGYSVLNTAVSYISIDVNPSIELALNKFDNVISAAAYNDDGAVILENINLKGKSYTEAVDTLLTDDEFISYTDEDSKLDFTVVSDDQNRIIEGIQGCHSYGQYNGSCHEASREMMSEAHSHGLSLGKYRAYLELSEYDSSVTAEDCQNMTMHQIHEMIDGHSSHNASGNTENYRGHGHGGHNGRHNRQ